jgi:hypothetical protein
MFNALHYEDTFFQLNLLFFILDNLFFRWDKHGGTRLTIVAANQLTSF